LSTDCVFHGRSFDIDPEAREYAGELGNEARGRRALAAVADLPSDLLAIGFSLGAILAERIALHRPVPVVVLLSGALSVRALDANRWPQAIPLQVHVAAQDPLRNSARIGQPLADARVAGSAICEGMGTLVEISGRVFRRPDCSAVNRSRL
jgi:pimeloyl-ACP methyl ester carboxylesterase